MSDTHGVPPEPLTDEWDIAVHSGDLLPNGSFGVEAVEKSFQPRWLAANVGRFPKKFRHKPFVFVPGNHEFIDPTPYLVTEGIGARLVVDEIVEVAGLRFWGHPWTPPFQEWNYMLRPKVMGIKLARLEEALAIEGVDVLVSHGPMYGVLDRNYEGERVGCRQLRDVLTATKKPPQALLHGHIHKSAGVTRWSVKRDPTTQQPMLVSNAACTQRIVEVKLR